MGCRNYTGRLNADGTIDTSFDPGVSGGVNFPYVDAIALQPDGKILVGGNFTQLGGQPRSRIGRLNPDGTLDTTFNPGASGNVIFPNYPTISTFLVQADGKVVVGGFFTQLGGQARNNIGRLNSNGTLDTSFNPGVSGPGGAPSVFALGVQVDGKIIVGGDFEQLGGQTRKRIGRLNPNGTLDTSFNPGVGAGEFSGGYYPVNALAIQADGKIVVSGRFFRMGELLRNNIGRCNPDGTVYNPPTVANIVSRKAHGSSGTFDLELLPTPAPVTECRGGGAGGNYQVLVTFANPVTVGGLTITSNNGMASGTQSASGAMVTVDLSAVADAQTLRITLTGVNDGTGNGDVTFSMGVLVGDTNGDRSVNSGDALQTRNRSGQTTDATNFRSDVNADGFVNSGDTVIVRVRSGSSLP